MEPINTSNAFPLFCNKPSSLVIHLLLHTSPQVPNIIRHGTFHHALLLCFFFALHCSLQVTHQVLLLPFFQRERIATPSGFHGLALHRRNVPNVLSRPKCLLCHKNQEVHINSFNSSSPNPSKLVKWK